MTEPLATRRARELRQRLAVQAAAATAPSHTLTLTAAELTLVLSGLGLELDRWVRRARGRDRQDAPWSDAVGRARACEELVERLRRHAGRGPAARRVGDSIGRCPAISART